MGLFNLLPIRNLLDLHQENIVNSVDPNSIRQEPRVKNHKGRITVDKVPVYVPPSLESGCRNIISLFSKNTTISNQLQELISNIGEADGKVFIKEKLNSLLAAFKALGTPKDNKSKEVAIGQALEYAKEFCRSVNSMDQELATKIQELGKKIRNNVDNLNTAIKELYYAKKHKEHPANENDTSTLGNYYAAVQKLAEFVSVRENGVGDITTEDGNLLVSNENYAVLNYEDHDGELSEHNPITVKYLDSQDTIGKNSSNIALKGGIIGGCIELRDKILPDQRREIQQSAEQVISKINEAAGGILFQDRYSGAISGDEQFGGKVKFTVVDSNGKKITRNGREVTPLTIDLEKLRPSTTGAVQTIASEFNRHFQHSFRGPRTVIGEVKDSADNSFDPPKYMANNIKLVAESNITDNQLTFDFELENTSCTGASFEVLSLSVGGKDQVGVGVDNFSPYEPFLLPNGETTRTNQNFTVNVPAGKDYCDVLALVRVRDENGNLETKNVKFTIDIRNQNILNNHYNATPRAPAAGAGVLDAAQIPPGVGFSTARAEIETRDEQNYLHFEGEEDYKILIDSEGSNFAQALKLNTIITQDPSSETLSFQLDENLTTESFPQHKIGASTPIKRKVNVGTKSAVLNMVFVGGVPIVPIAPAIGDTLTIRVTHAAGVEQGYIFTFAAAPAAGAAPLNNNEIEVKANLQEQLEKIVKKVNSFNSFTAGYQSIVKASSDGANTITFESPKGNNFNNKINIGMRIGVHVVPAGAFRARNLTGGESEEQTKTYSALGDAKPSFGKLTNLINTDVKDNLTSAASKISSDATLAKAEAEAAENSAKTLKKERIAKVGVDGYQTMMEMQQLQYIYQSVMLSFNVQKSCMDYLFQIAAR